MADGHAADVGPFVLEDRELLGGDWSDACRAPIATPVARCALAAARSTRSSTGETHVFSDPISPMTPGLMLGVADTVGQLADQLVGEVGDLAPFQPLFRQVIRLYQPQPITIASPVRSESTRRRSGERPNVGHGQVNDCPAAEIMNAPTSAATRSSSSTWSGKS